MAESKFTVYDFIILGVTVLLLIGSLLLSLFSPELMNPLTTFSFQLLTLIATVYIAFKLTKIAVMNKTIELQKNTAKTAIRHIRGYQRNLSSLIEIIKEKVEKVSSEKHKDSLTEINHHLEYFSIGIALSENDFKDILGEEFKEEHLLLVKVASDIEQANRKIVQLEDLRKEEKAGNKEKIDELNNEIEKLRGKISKDISELPISGSVRSVSGIPSTVYDAIIAQTPSLTKSYRDLLNITLPDDYSKLTESLAKAFSKASLPDSPLAQKEDTESNNNQESDK